MLENQIIDKKSIRSVTGTNPDWKELAKDCVCFANARGGSIVIGIENEDNLPPAGQKIDKHLPEKIRKRISELTINVNIQASIIHTINDGEYIEVKVFPSLSTIASTTDGRYYLRISDTCTPLMPEDLTRLLTDKPAFNWETKISRKIPVSELDLQKLKQFLTDIQMSDRVSDFVKQKASHEILSYYLMVDDGMLTNLGVLWVGKREDRAKLLYAPMIQFLKYDENGNRVNKMVWDDYSLNPKELIEEIWTKIPDWREGLEVADGIFRKFIPNYEEEIIRELLANALVHRPYTTRGDIFINLYPDRIELHNPGRLPVGVTPENILHKTIKRNEHLAKVFYDLKLMEREGSGYDKMYEVLLANGKQVPLLNEGDDRVAVTIKKRILSTEIIKIVGQAEMEFGLGQREIICLGLIAQHTTLSAIDFSRILNLPQPKSIQDWIGRLLDFNLVKTKGKTKGVEYFINPEFLRIANFKGKTNLKRIENHRLRELIVQDLAIYPNSLLSSIHERIGTEIRANRIREHLTSLIKDTKVSSNGGRKFRRYSLITESS